MKNKILINKFFIDKNGNKYILFKKSGIPMLYLMTDNIKLTRFDDEKNIYISLEEIINWNKKMLNEISDNEKKEIIENNIKFLEYHLNRKIM